VDGPEWIASGAAAASTVGGAAPCVSVLVPSFNHGAYLESCLDSVLAEGHSPLELVVLDDGSSDDSVAIATAWMQRHGAALAGGCKIGRQQNRGITTTLNRLVAAASGEFVIVLASDDALLPGGIASRLALLADRPDLLAAFGDAEPMHLDGRPAGRSAFDVAGSDRTALRHRATLGVELISHWVMPGSVMLLRRQTFSRIGPFDQRYGYEDRDYVLRLIAARAVGFVDRPVTRYRMPPEKKQERYVALARDRVRIEFSHVSRFKGLERIALLCVAWRRARPHSIWVRPLKKLLSRIRRFNRGRARRLDTSPGPR
jgi:glycosyltransferase involved in cell wall biosynthesis